MKSPVLNTFCINLLFIFRDPRNNAIMYYYHSPLQDSSHCSLNETDIVTRCFSLLLCAILVYLAAKTLFAKYRGFKARQRNASTLIDETEVELNTIDSIDEFEKMSKTGTSDEGRPGRRGRKRLQCLSGRPGRGIDEPLACYPYDERNV